MVNDAGTGCDGPNAPAASQLDPLPNLNPAISSPHGTGSSNIDGGVAVPAVGADAYPVPNGGNAVTAFMLANLAADLPPVPANKRDGMQGSAFAQLRGCCSSGAELAARHRASCKDRTPGWYLTFEVGDDDRLAYGASNQLIATANVVQKAWRENRTLVWPVAKRPPTVTNHGDFFLDMLRVRFDMSEFFATFCVITADQMPPKEMQKDVVHMHSNAAFYDYTSWVSCGVSSVRRKAPHPPSLCARASFQH